MIVTLSFIKLLSYIRIYDDFGFLISMIMFCIKDLMPFLVSFVIFLLVFTVCFIVLNVSQDADVANELYVGYFQKMFLAIFRTSIG